MTTTTKKTPNKKNPTKPKNVNKSLKTSTNKIVKPVSNKIPTRSRIKKWTKVLLQKEITKWEKFVVAEKITPTLQSFFLFIPKTTIQGWRNNENQRELWDEYYNRVYVVVEFVMINKLMESKNTAANIMFYLKAAFKYSDRPDILSDTYEIKIDLTNTGPNKLKKENKK